MKCVVPLTFLIRPCHLVIIVKRELPGGHTARPVLKSVMLKAYCVTIKSQASVLALILLHTGRRCYWRLNWYLTLITENVLTSCQNPAMAYLPAYLCFVCCFPWEPGVTGSTSVLLFHLFRTKWWQWQRFLQAGYTSCDPSNRVRVLKEKVMIVVWRNVTWFVLKVPLKPNQPV